MAPQTAPVATKNSKDFSVYNQCAVEKPKSIVPSPPSNASQLETSVHRYAFNMERGRQVVHCLNRLIHVQAPLSLLKKYNVRKIAGKYLYNFETMDLVVNLAEKIKYLEKKEQRKKNVSIPHPVESIPVAETKENEISTSNVFLSGTINVTTTLDRLLNMVKKTDQ